MDWLEDLNTRNFYIYFPVHHHHHHHHHWKKTIKLKVEMWFNHQQTLYNRIVRCVILLSHTDQTEKKHSSSCNREKERETIMGAMDESLNRIVTVRGIPYIWTVRPWISTLRYGLTIITFWCPIFIYVPNIHEFLIFQGKCFSSPSSLEKNSVFFFISIIVVRMIRLFARRIFRMKNNLCEKKEFNYRFTMKKIL